MIRKLVLNDGRSERELILKGTLLVGRDPYCHINDLDPLLSRRHAEFVSGLQGVMVRDLGSRNGILVNGVKVPQQMLVPGDVVQLGHLELRYIEDATTEALEQYTRAHGVDGPTTLAPAPRPEGAPRSRPPGAVVPAESIPTPPAPGGDSRLAVDLDVTMPPGRPSAAPPAPAAAGGARAVDDDEDLKDTRAIAMKAFHPSLPRDLDATIAPSAMASGGAPSLRAPGLPPRGPSAESNDDTRMPAGRQGSASVNAASAAGGSAAAAGVEARIVADRSLIVTEATGSCVSLLGILPETAVGGQLTEALARALSFVAAGSGPSPLTLSVARGRSGGSLTITFKA